MSHDIKTPVASIKAISEPMMLQVQNEKERSQLNTINAKADQIDLLINNMFHAALEELQELKVTVSEIPSNTIRALIAQADYHHRVISDNIPACIVLADFYWFKNLIMIYDGNKDPY